MKTSSSLHPNVSKFLNQNPIPAFLNGKWTATHGGVADVIDPGLGRPITQVAEAGPEDVNAAVEAAHRAFPQWSGLPVAERAALLHRLAEAIEAHTEELAQLEALDVGKPVENARSFDVPFGAECLRYFADLSVHTNYSTPLALKNIEAHVHRTPYGVCGFIFPWNFPFTLFCWGVGPALAAGNTVVVKASEVTPLSTLYLGHLAKEVGIPAGVINIYTGDGSACGQPLAEHPLVRRMSFTGSTTVGKKIGAICGERLIPCKLELGGKGAALVLDDADVSAAAEGLAGAITLNTGQVCCTATRWFLHEGVYDQFLDKVRANLTAITIGHGLHNEKVQMGPLVSKTQLQRVTGYYERGLAEGATPLLEMCRPDGVAEDGYFVTPHLLGGDTENVCYREEVFGPAAYLVKYSDPAAAVEQINSLPYGLANSVWTTDMKRAVDFAEHLVAGNSWINAHNVFAYGLPYGGVNLSGFGGGVNSPETLQDYLRPQTIARPL